MAIFDETKSVYDYELESKKRIFDLDALQLVFGPRKEDPPPTFELNSIYDPDTKTVKAYLGKWRVCHNLKWSALCKKCTSHILHFLS